MTSYHLGRYQLHFYGSLSDRIKRLSVNERRSLNSKPNSGLLIIGWLGNRFCANNTRQVMWRQVCHGCDTMTVSSDSQFMWGLKTQTLCAHFQFHTQLTSRNLVYSLRATKVATVMHSAGISYVTTCFLWVPE